MPIAGPGSRRADPFYDGICREPVDPLTGVLWTLSDVG